MSKEIKEKFERVEKLSRILHMKVLYTFMQKQFERYGNNFSRLRLNFDDESEVKIYLLDILLSNKNKYGKLINLRIEECDIYEEIYDAINKEFPVFPFSWEEYEFKKTMDKAFGTDADSNYLKDLINKNTKKYK